MSCACGGHFCYRCGRTLEDNMPCDCEGRLPWVEAMDAEAAVVEGEDDESEEGDEQDGIVSEGDGVVQEEEEEEGEGTQATGGW